MLCHGCFRLQVKIQVKNSYITTKTLYLILTILLVSIYQLNEFIFSIQVKLLVLCVRDWISAVLQTHCMQKCSLLEESAAWYMVLYYIVRHSVMNDKY